MLCDNCNNNEANIKYTQIINGVKKQMNLCSHCAEKLGLNDMSFSMSRGMEGFIHDFFGDNPFNSRISIQEPLFENIFENEFKGLPGFTVNTGTEKNVLDDEMDMLVKKLNKESKKRCENKEKKLKDDKNEKIKNLQKRLEKEIKEERYEDAAKTRDEIKKLK